MNGSLEAFAIDEQLNEDTAVIYSEKADPEVKVLSRLINNWFCKNHLKGFKWANREQGLGIPGLKRAKIEYNPIIS